MISYQQAIKIIKEESAPITITSIDIGDALGMVSAEDVICQEIVPPFNNSAMDGFAVNSKNISTIPIKLNVEGSTAAGELPDNGGDGAWEIMTGAPVPQAYNTVIRIEDIDIVRSDSIGSPKEILIKVPAIPKQNIRNAGEDFIIGDMVLKSGDIITPEHIMALSTVGTGKVTVRSNIIIAIVNTGKELVDDISKKLMQGQIRNSNAPYLMAILSSAGVEAKYIGTIHDKSSIFEEKITDLLKEDINIIISTGAVSMGRYDFIPDSLRKLGAKILFHKVAIRPGKPILFAKLPNGAFYFGLPGNPVSAAVGLRFFVYPLIRNMHGLEEEVPIFARISSSRKKKVGLKFFYKAYLYSDDTGQYYVDILDGQESFKINPMLKANCWAVLPEESSKVEANKVIEVFPFSLNHFTNNRKI